MSTVCFGRKKVSDTIVIVEYIQCSEQKSLVSSKAESFFTARNS